MSPSSREGGCPHSDLVSGLESWGRAKLDQSSRRAAQVTARSSKPTAKDPMRMWQTKRRRAASIAQGERFAERWCAARLYPEMQLRAAVARMVDGSPGEPLPPLPGLPPTPEQLQQARRLAEAGAKELERVKEALEPGRPLAVTTSRAWLRRGPPSRGDSPGDTRATTSG